jgi:hypothetical protein
MRLSSSAHSQVGQEATEQWRTDLRGDAALTHVMAPRLWLGLRNTTHTRPGAGQCGHARLAATRSQPSKTGRYQGPRGALRQSLPPLVLFQKSIPEGMGSPARTPCSLACSSGRAGLAKLGLLPPKSARRLHTPCLWYLVCSSRKAPERAKPPLASPRLRCTDAPLS